MEYDLRTPYAYLMEAMIFVKAAAENGGKVDMQWRKSGHADC